MYYRRDLFSVSTNAKTVLDEERGYLVGVMYLAPAMKSGVQMCPTAAIAECEMPCLDTSGRGSFANIQNARIEKTLQFARNRDWFMECVARSIESLISKAERLRFTPVVRLSGTSDNLWEKIEVPSRKEQNIMSVFPGIQFYDYTKISKRLSPDYTLPRNYDLTFSFSAAPAFASHVRDAETYGARIAVVFRDRVPEEFMGRPVVDGDGTDLRFLDPKDCIVGLRARGRAKKSDSPLVVDL